MRQDILRQEDRTTELNVPEMAATLDRIDVLLLRQFYLTTDSHPHDTTSYVLKILVDKLKKSREMSLNGLSYGRIRHRLENLVDLGLLGKIPQTNPKIYYPHDKLAQSVRSIIFHFAAEIVGLKEKGGGT